MKRLSILGVIVLSGAVGLLVLLATTSRVRPVTLEPGESSLNEILELWSAGDQDAALAALRETGVERASAATTYECFYLQESDMRWLRQFAHQDDIVEGIAICGQLADIAREIRRRAGDDEDHPDIALIYAMADELQKPTRLVLFQQVGRGLPMKRPHDQ